MARVRLLIVDDSPFCQQMIINALADDPEIEVVGTASDGIEAVAKAAELKPDVITMDVEMPELDGIAATNRIMAETPTPTLMLTGDPRNQAMELTHRALAAGAMAIHIKPSIDESEEAWNLANDIKRLAAVPVSRHPVGRLAPRVSADSGGLTLEGGLAPAIVAIASGIGGQVQVQKILSELPNHFPAPVLVVQQLHSAFVEAFAEWLMPTTPMPVQVVTASQPVQPGHVYLAPAFGHLALESRNQLTVRIEPPIDGYLPSADLMLESVAKAYGPRAVGILLSGAGNDGVYGAASIRAAHGRMIAQSEESCLVFGAAKLAIERGLIDVIAHGDSIGGILGLAAFEREARF